MPTLNIDVLARFAEFKDGLDQITRHAATSANRMNSAFGVLKGTLATLGVSLSVGALGAFVKNSIDAADRLNDLSKKTGIAVETLGGLGFAAQQSGSGLESMSEAVGKLNRSIAEAGVGNKEKGEAFKALGINVRDATGNLKNADLIMIELADRFASFEDGPNKVAIAIRLLGRAGADLIPTLNEGGASIQRNVEYYKRFSGVTKDVAERADQFNDTMAKVGLLSSSLGTRIAGELLGPLQKMAERMLEAKEKSTLFETSATALKVAFAGLIAVGSTAVFVFEAMGTKLGALFAQAAALARGDIKGALTIGKEAQGDIDRARASLEKYVQSLLKAKSAEQQQDEESGRGVTALRGGVKGQAPGLADTGSQGRADAAAKALTDLIAAQSRIVVAAEQAQATERLRVLDHFYREGFVAEERYWQVRGDIQKSAYEIEARALDANTAARFQAVKDAAKTHGGGSKEATDALRELSEAQAKRNDLDAKFNAQGNTDVLARAKATQDYEKAIEAVNIQLLQLQGNTAEAARRQVALNNESLRKDAAGRGAQGEAGKTALDTMEKATVAQARFNQVREQAAEVNARLAIEEERIQNSHRTGAISDLEAMRRTEQARKNSVSAGAFLVAQLDAIAKSSGLPTLILQSEQAKVSLESLAASANLVGDKVKKTFEDAFTDEFAKVIDGTQKISDAFRNMARNILSEIAKIQARSIAQSITGGGGGFLGDIFKNLFSGGGSIGYGTISNFLPVNGPYAMGTDYVPSTGLAYLHKGEQVIPAGQDSGGATIINNYQIDSRSDRAEIVSMIQQSGQRTLSQVADMTRRGGGYSKAVRGG